MKFLVPLSKGLLERGLLPDAIIRFGMRQLLRQKLLDESKGGLEAVQKRKTKLIEDMRKAPIAVNTKDANEQHYELPTDFFQMCLGKNLKYSSCYYALDTEILDQAEDDMLAITCKRAELQDGQRILELGCGWGSLSLFMATMFPNAQITGVSNSKTQKAFIDEQAQKRGLKNLKIITCDMNVFEISDTFDRVVSVEMFEHMRNWQELFKKISGFLKKDGKLFFHIFTHRQYAYFYDAQDEGDFIGRYFFTGGIMPSDSLPLYFQEHLRIERHWCVPGVHYAKTSEAWLENMDSNKEKIMPILKTTYGPKDYIKWWHYWRIFYMACAELWGYKKGAEWIVS
ncbi:MAG: cyclopropane-fatty-acyl-phospholipid synthase family protein, partial [Candidatus Omnitrophota bacterium]